MQAENLYAVTGFVSRAKCGSGPKIDNGLVNKKKNCICEQVSDSYPGTGLHDTNKSDACAPSDGTNTCP